MRKYRVQERWWCVLHRPKIYGIAIATFLCFSWWLAWDILIDRTPPFTYIQGGGGFFDCADWKRFDTCVARADPVRPGEEIVRSRQTTGWTERSLSECDIEVTGHLVDANGHARETDRFRISVDPRWLEDTKAGRPTRHTRPLTIPSTMAASFPEGGEPRQVPIAAGPACYFSLDNAQCNAWQRFFKTWQMFSIEIPGPMMCLAVEAK